MCMCIYVCLYVRYRGFQTCKDSCFLDRQWSQVSFHSMAYTDSRLDQIGNLETASIFPVHLWKIVWKWTMNLLKTHVDTPVKDLSLILPTRYILELVVVAEWRLLPISEQPTSSMKNKLVQNMCQSCLKWHHLWGYLLDQEDSRTLQKCL